MATSVSAHEIAEALGGELTGPAGTPIDAIGPLDSATPSTISFLAHPRYRPQLETTRAGCVIVAPRDRDAVPRHAAAIVTPDPYLYFARLTQWWGRRVRDVAAPGVHPSAVVDSTARIGAGACVAAYAVIEARAVVGDRAVIGAYCFVGQGAQIGATTRFAPRVTLGERCSIGARCIVHSGVVIGADGFGFAPDGGRWEKIEQLGAVRIGDDVEIGANTCIDRGALDDTVIEDGVKLDNLIQIGHNVLIGAHTVIAGNAGVAGSARIGARCMIGGAANILGHLTLAEGVHISPTSLVTRSIHRPGLYTGAFPIDDNASWEKNAATLRQLHALRDRVRALEKKT